VAQELPEFRVVTGVIGRVVVRYLLTLHPVLLKQVEALAVVMVPHQVAAV
jgi:hypothetical protein